MNDRRTAQLEERLNDLVGLLRATGEITTGGDASNVAGLSVDSADTGSSPGNARSPSKTFEC